MGGGRIFERLQYKITLNSQPLLLGSSAPLVDMVLILLLLVNLFMFGC